MTFGADADLLVKRIFGAWLLQPTLHGCDFASWAAKKNRIHLATYFDAPSSDLVASLNDQIQVAREAGNLALAIFPRIEAETEVAALVSALRGNGRWSCGRRELEGRLALDLRHTPASDATPCSAIGFGPLPAMPSNRRAPYVALAVWPGGYDNASRKTRDAFVGVGDMRHDIDAEQYAQHFKHTRRRTSEFRDVLHESGVVTGITFCLSPELAADAGEASGPSSSPSL